MELRKWVLRLGFLRLKGAAGKKDKKARNFSRGVDEGCVNGKFLRIYETKVELWETKIFHIATWVTQKKSFSLFSFCEIRRVVVRG